MKLLLPFFIYLTFSIQTFSQSIVLLGAEFEKVVVPGAEVKTSFQIKNTSKSPIRLAVKLLNSENSQNYTLCYHDNCWDDLTSFETIRLAPGQTLDGLVLKFRAGFDLSVHDVKLHFYNADNPVEQLSHTFNFTIKDNFSNGILFSQEGIKVSNAYPNPTSSLATIDYDIVNLSTNAKIEIHNLLGNKVMEVPLEKGEVSAKISTDTFDNGIYFYSLYIDGKRVTTKKLVVKK